MLEKKLTFNEAASKEVVLELRNIKKYFPGVKALDGVDLKLRKGTIMALMGENGAGKSTIMKTLFGIHKRTSGEIIYKGKDVEFKGPRDAMEHGVSMVHQELNQVLTTSVIDNVWLGRFPKIGPFVNKVKMISDTKKIFKELEINVNPTMKISELSVSKRQMIEIAKAISYNSEVLILDEPTSSLTEVEVEQLFKIIKKLANNGVSILFVSHKMSEIFKIADFVTIFRDGKYISEGHISEYDEQKIIKDMVGRDLEKQFPERVSPKKDAKNMLEVQNISSKYDTSVQGVSFKLKKGEILGIAGLVGSGRTEFAELLFGTRTKDGKSKVLINNQEVEIWSPKNAMSNGIAMITEERKKDGIFGNQDIEFNTTIAQLNVYKGFMGLLKKELMNSETKNMIEKFNTKTPSHKVSIASLSGGNQQKVIISRWLLRQPNIFIMDEPTRGIDVGAKYSIYELMNKMAELDKSIVMISSEMAELIGVCNRIAVMSNGKLAGIIDGKTATQEKIMELASQYY